MEGTVSYTVCIPSYKRSRTLATKTLPLLAARKIPPERIIVYVADEEEASLYRQTLQPEAYAEIRVACPGMGAVRNFITDDHPADARLLCLDDDLEDFLLRLNSKTLIPLDDLDDFATRAFDFTERVGLRLWGLYPVLNPLFMKPTVTGDLRYIIGSVWGIRNLPGAHVHLDDKEDFERSLRRYCADGGVVRFNFASMKSRYYTEPGGMQETRTEERVTASAKALVTAFPRLCTLNTSKKSGHTEVRLRDKAGLGVLARVKVEPDGHWSL
jgi:hypothetical protein